MIDQLRYECDLKIALSQPTGNRTRPCFKQPLFVAFACFSQYRHGACKLYVCVSYLKKFMENSMEPRSSKSRSLTTKVGARIRRAIVDAEFGLGEILSEEKLAAAFGISRTPVRATRSPRCKPRD